jgi:hypothetical protein
MFTAIADPTLTEQITPYLPLIGVVFGALIIEGFRLWNRKRGAIETKAPDVNDIWQREERQNKELDIERRMRRRFEDLAGQLWLAFRNYAARVQGGGSTELTSFEQRVIDNGTDIGDTEPAHPVQP